MTENLTGKRQHFVNAYVGEAAGNATKAAVLAGYSERTARQAGSRLLTIPDVKAAIQHRQRALVQQTDVTAERVIRELALIAFSDVRGLFDEDGKLKPVHELPEDVARALASVEVTKSRTTTRDEVSEHELVTKVKTWDKTKALEMLGRRLALWQDRDRDASRIVVNIGFLGDHSPIVVTPPRESDGPDVVASQGRVALPGESGSGRR